MAQMNVADAAALARCAFSAAVIGPWVEPQATISRSPDRDRPRERRRERPATMACDFFGAQANHVFVVQRLVVHVAGDVLFFEAADAVLESRRAGNGPGARERLGIAPVGLETLRIGFEVHGNFRQF